MPSLVQAIIDGMATGAPIAVAALGLSFVFAMATGYSNSGQLRAL